MINVLKGWPNGHASESSFPVLTGQDIVEGDFVMLDNDGSGNPVWRLATSADTQQDLDHRGGQALDTNTAFGYDVRYTGKLPVVRSNYTAQTDRFSASSLVPGDQLEIDAARPGRLKIQSAGAVAAVVEAYDAASGILTIRRA